MEIILHEYTQIHSFLDPLQCAPHYNTLSKMQKIACSTIFDSIHVLWSMFPVSICPSSLPDNTNLATQQLHLSCLRMKPSN